MIPPLLRQPRALAALLLVAACAGAAFAAGTNPTLALSSAAAVRSSQGIVTVEVRGTFNFDDLIQFPFPAGVIVIQGDNFARYDYADGAAAGEAAFLADGFVAGELSSLLATGAAAPAPASLLRLEPSRIVLALPPQFAPGSVTVVVYAILENTSFLSNAVTCDIPQP